MSGDLTKPGVIEAIFQAIEKEGTLPYAVLYNAAVFKPDDARENMATNKHAPLRILRMDEVDARRRKKGLMHLLRRCVARTRS